MVRAKCPDGDVWTYAYDPFGRRISKACKHTKVTFIWDGDVIAREITERRHIVGHFVLDADIAMVQAAANRGEPV